MSTSNLPLTEVPEVSEVQEEKNPVGKELPMAPVGEEESDEISRFQFIKVAVGGVCLMYAAAIGYPVYRYLASPVEKAQAASAVSEVTLKEADKLPAGSAMMFKFGTRPSLLIHHPDNTWVALDAVCTHLGCTVQYHQGQQKILCACHGGVYDARTGDNLSGPPPKPLTRYVTRVQPGAVVVTRS